MRLLIFCFLFACGLWQCTNSDPATDSTTETTQVTEINSAAANSSAAVETTASASSSEPAPVHPFLSISSEKMKYLWDNCDYVDFVMYGTNFSMSQSEQNAIRTTLAGISTTPASVYPECKPVGRIFFQVDGKNEAEADIFFGGNCAYYLFLTNGTYTMGNQFTEQAINFYQRIFTQVSTQPAN